MSYCPGSPRGRRNQRPLELGGTLGSASPDVLRELSRYGELVGEGPVDALDLVDVPAADVTEALTFSEDEWRKELPLIDELFDFVGEKLPSSLRDELDGLKQRLA